MKPTRRNIVALTVLNYALAISVLFVPYLLVGPMIIIVAINFTYVFKMRRAILRSARL